MGDGDLEEEGNQIEDLMAHAAVASLSAASDEIAASHRIVMQLRGALATDVPGLVLMRLLLTVADLPSVCQVCSHEYMRTLYHLLISSWF